MLGRKRRDEDLEKLRSESTGLFVCLFSKTSTGSHIPQNPVRPVKQNTVCTDKKSLDLLKMPNLQLDCRMEIRQRSKQEELDRRKVIRVLMFVMMVWLTMLIMVV